MYLSLDQPFNLAHTLECGQAFRWRRLGEWYYGVIQGNVIKIRGDSQGLEYHSALEPEERLEPLLKRYFRLDDDLHYIYHRINKDDRIGEAIARYQGLRLLRQDPWECLISYVCSAAANIRQIGHMVESLGEGLGERVALGDHVRYSFPTPSQLARAKEKDLRDMKTGFRAKYVFQIARIVHAGDFELEALRNLSYQEAKRELLNLPGVGDKVADCVLLFSLDKLQAFPIDRWVRRAVQEWYFAGERVSDKEMRAWALDYFGPYAGYAQQYLFYSRRLVNRD